MNTLRSFITNLRNLRTTLSAPMRYALAVAIFCLALLVRVWVFPVESGLPFLTFYPAVVIALYLCGIGPGALVVALSSLTGHYLFTPPYLSWVPTRDDYFAVGIFVFSTFLIGALVKELQDALAGLHASAIELNRSEQHYRGLLEDQTDLICRYRADGTILYVNDAYCHLFGKSREELVGHFWHPIACREDVPLIEASLKTLSPSNPIVTIENRVVTKDNTLGWRQFVNRAFFDDQGQILEIQSVGRDIDERKRLDAELMATKERFQDLYDHAPCGYHSLDANGIYLSINQTELGWLGCAREDVIGKLSLSDFFTAEGKEQFRRLYPRFLADGHIENLEYDLIGKDGRVLRVSLSGVVTRDADGRFAGSRTVLYDITELRQAREELLAVSKQQQAMLDNELVAIVKMKDRKAIWFNKGLSRIFGYEPAELQGRSSRVMYPDDASFEALGKAAYPVINSQGLYRTQCEMRRKDGEKLWIDMSGFLLSQADGVSMWIMADITQMKRREEKYRHDAGHDALTGLPNRTLLTDQLGHAIAQAQWLKQTLAVCYLDLDRFKPINDEFGHETGDRVLKEVAHRLKGAVRGSDLVCRHGGDEFVVLLIGLESMDECRLVLRRILQQIGQPYALGEARQVRVTASVGVALLSSEAGDPETLLRHADRAMYQAKNLGGSRFAFYRQEDMAGIAG